MASRDVFSYMFDQQKKCQAYPDLCQAWSKIEEFYSKKLWHQLTLKVQEIVKHSYFSENGRTIELYKRFVSDFEHRMNPLVLIELVILVAKQMKDLKEALEFLEKMKENVKTNSEASILCMIAIGNIHLQIGDLAKTKTLILEMDKLVNDLDRITSVHQRFYELSSNYYRIVIDYANYYRDSLRYLGCIDMKNVKINDFQERAFNVCLAAILGKNLYNFGELIAHPVLESLKNPQQQWLVDLLHAFNSGNIQQFTSLKPHWNKQKFLSANVKIMEEKISLLCLMEMTFKRPANHRQLTFQEISEQTKKPMTDVELLVMKALSLGLVKGQIDGVDGRVHMTWVQPRVLDLQQIKGMKERVEKWVGEVEKMESLVEANAHELLT